MAEYHLKTLLLCLLLINYQSTKISIMFKNLVFVLSILVLVSSCVEKADTPRNNVDKISNNKKSPVVANNKPKAGSNNRSKPKGNRVVNYGYAKLGNIAGKNTKKTPGNIIVNKSPVVIGGWAIDQVNQSLPKAVFVVIGDKQFRANMGAPSGYLTKTFKNKPQYAKAGFSIAINKDKLKPGRNEVYIRTVGQDDVNYISKDKATVIVR